MSVPARLVRRGSTNPPASARSIIVSTVSYDIHMSLDGYVRARNPTPDAPLGQGGDVLHEYAFGGGDAAGLELMERSLETLGAVICGRRTYDDSLRWWGPDGPTG